MRGRKKRPGSAKRSKKLGFEIHEERIIVPEEIPATAKFNGYRDYDVQELKLERHNIRFRLAEYVREDGSTLVGKVCPRSIVRATTARCWWATSCISTINVGCPSR